MNPSTFELQLSLGKGLQLARQSSGLTQSELADEAGLSRATIAKIESGDADPKLSTLSRLAAALQVSPTWLMMSEQDMEVLARIASTSNIDVMLEQLPDEKIGEIRALAKAGRMKKVVQVVEQLESALGDEAEESDSPGGPVAGATAIATGLLPGIGTALGKAWSRIQAEFDEESADESYQWTSYNPEDRSETGDSETGDSETGDGLTWESADPSRND
jgi:transcriptional regulator with XRE-family HTH domain